MWYIPYNKNLKPFSRQLRKNSTLGEVLLWLQLRSGGMIYQFNRQKPIGEYIVDFYSKPLCLVIEVDGKYHGEEDQWTKDVIRDEFMKKQNLALLRFTELEVRKNLEGVLSVIENYIMEYEKSHPEVRKYRKKNLFPAEKKE